MPAFIVGLYRGTIGNERPSVPFPSFWINKMMIMMMKWCVTSTTMCTAHCQNVLVEGQSFLIVFQERKCAAGAMLNIETDLYCMCCHPSVQASWWTIYLELISLCFMSLLLCLWQRSHNLCLGYFSEITYFYKCQAALPCFWLISFLFTT